MELKIKEIRDNAGFSQYEMAEKMNLSQSAYARFELSKTKIDLNRLEVFANALNMSIVDVIKYPERYVNVRDIAKEIKSFEPDVTIQIKVKEEKKDEVLKIVLGENNVELLR